jgi:hypothetical protein
MPVKTIILLMITAFLDFVHALVSKKLENNVSETGSVSIPRWRWGTTTSLGSLERANPNHYASD